MRVGTMLNRSLSFVLALCLTITLWLPLGTSTAIAAEGEPGVPFQVVETDSLIVVHAQTYVIEIEKAGFKYSFKKADGTVIVDGHQQSGLRYTAPGGSTLFDAAWTELVSHDSSKLQMIVTSTTGQKADVAIYPFATYAQFEIAPREETGGDSEQPAEPNRTLRLMVSGGDSAAALIDNSSWAYDEIESHVMIESSTGSSASGLVFGYKQDTGHYYYARLHDNKKELQLLRTKSSDTSALEVVASEKLDISRNVWYDMRIALDGGTIKLYINDQEQLEWSDAAADFTGLIGVKSFKTTIHFNEIIVRNAGTVVYEDDFQTSDTSGWTVQQGQLDIVAPDEAEGEETQVDSENMLVFDSLSTTNGLAWTGTPSWQYDSLEANMLIENSAGSSASGIVFGYQNPYQYYYVRLHDANSEVQLLKTKADNTGTLEVKAKKTGESINKNVWYNLKVQITGSTIAVFVDGVQKLSWTDPAPAFAGAIGTKAYRSTVHYAQITVANGGETVYEDDFADGKMDDWTVDDGQLSIQKRVENQTFIIDARTAPASPAYGLGDDGRFGDGLNVYGFSDDDRTYIENNGTTSRFISNFVVFPKHGFAQVLFDDHGKKRVTINGAENKMGVARAEQIDRLYYFFGDLKQIYADYQQVRFNEDYPDYKPKYNFFEVGYEAFGSLGWNTAQATVTEDLQKYLERGYRLKWAIAGSGFWKGDRNDPTQGATTSFGIWDDTYQEGRTDKYANPRYPDVAGFKQFLSDNDMKFFIGLRTNFKALPEDGGYYNPVNDGPYTQQGVDNGYFVKSKSVDGSPQKFTVNAFPNGPVYLLDPEREGAVEWFKQGADLWQVDGFKEDTMARAPSSDSLWNKPNEALMEDGYYVMVRNSAYSVPGDIIRLEDTRWDYDQDRPVLVALSMAASGAPNVYSDIVAGKSLPKNLTEDQKLYFVRNALFAALTPAMSMGLGPWSMQNEVYEADVKKAVDFHSMYAPYIYSAAVDSFETGFPYTMTPLPIAFPNDENTYDLANLTTRQYEWMLGESMLATPLFGNDLTTATSRDVYLPEGKWIDYETGTVYNGPVTLTDHELPLGKMPVFIGGKGVLVKRDLATEKLHAEVYPIATDGSEYVYTYPDGVTKSSVINNNTGWNKDTLAVTDTTAGAKVTFEFNEKTGHLTFELIEGHNYALSGGGEGNDDGGNGGEGNGGEGDGGNGGEGSVQPGGNEPEEPGAADDVRVVTDTELKQASEDGFINIKMEQKQRLVKLPAAAAQLDDGTVIRLEAAGFRAEISSESLRQLAGKAGEEPIEAFIVDIGSVELTAGQRSALGDDLRLNGEAVRQLALSLQLKNGETLTAASWSPADKFAFDYNKAATDSELLGIYRYNSDSGKWVYIGGTVDASQGRITVDWNEPGLYVALERHKTFSDVADTHWAYRTLQVLSARHIVNGVSDTRYAPSGVTTRAEFTALLVRALGLSGADGNAADAAAMFDDVAENDWFAEDVIAAYKAGLVQGVSDDRFAPKANITREQMAVMIVRAFEYASGAGAVKASDTEMDRYADSDELSSWAADAVSKAVAAGLMQGTATDIFNPRGNATRAQTAQSIYNLLELLRQG